MVRKLLLGALVALPGLVSAGVSDRVAVLERRMDTVTDLLVQIDGLKNENAELRGEMELLKHQLQQLKEQQRELYLDMDRRLSGDTSAGAGPKATAPTGAPAAAGPTGTGSAPPPAERSPQQAPRTDPAGAAGGAADAVPAAVGSAGADPSEQERRAYQDAYALLIPQRRYPEAIGAFRDFLGTYPSGRYSDNAQFWLGEAHYAGQDYDGALREFQKLADVYPESPKVPDALLKVGYIRQAEGDYARARDVFEGLVQHYPSTSAARLAEQRLKALASDRR
ncbi:MAG: tol-pal system protein YbgF [Pseudomonadota bacterium]